MQTQIETHLGTHGNYKALLQKGFSEEQAEGIIEIMAATDKNYTTKGDLEAESHLIRSELKSECNLVRSELREEMSNLRQELKTEMSDLKQELTGDMKDMETRLVKLIYINTFTIIGVLTAILKFF